MLRLTVVSQDEITEDQKKALEKLGKECFFDIPQQYIEENFFARGFIRLFAYKDSEAVGTLELYKRNVEFAGREIVVSGMGGVCVTKNTWRKQESLRLNIFVFSQKLL